MRNYNLSLTLLREMHDTNEGLRQLGEQRLSKVDPNSDTHAALTALIKDSLKFKAELEADIEKIKTEAMNERTSAGNTATEGGE